MSTDTMIATLLTRVDPGHNMRRFYRVEATRDLFGGLQIIREWGRIGTRGQRRVHWCASLAEAETLRDRLLSAKLRRGYSPAG